MPVDRPRKKIDREGRRIGSMFKISHLYIYAPKLHTAPNSLHLYPQILSIETETSVNLSKFLKEGIKKVNGVLHVVRACGFSDRMHGKHSTPYVHGSYTSFG
jgi:hypothetical protein